MPMRRRHVLLYAIVSFLSFNVTVIFTMLFYSPSGHSPPASPWKRHQQPDVVGILPPDDDDVDKAADDTNRQGDPALQQDREQDKQQEADRQKHIRRRPANRLMTEYDPDVARRVTQLAARRAESRDPELVALARDVIDPPPSNAAGYKMLKYSATPQSNEVDKLLEKMEGGFFVECGGLDGERLSNTAFLERDRDWTGLLVEMDPYFYTQLLGKNRQVWSVNACLSPYNYFTTLPYAGDTRGRGQLIVDGPADGDAPQPGKKPRRVPPLTVPCFPLDTILTALNRTTVDYFSLDIEGFELPVLKSVDWDRVDIRVLSVEFNRGKEKTAYREYMEAHGYHTLKELHNGPFFVHDFIFLTNKLHKSLRRRGIIDDDLDNAVKVKRDKVKGIEEEQDDLGEDDHPAAKAKKTKDRVNKKQPMMQIVPDDEDTD